MSEYEVLYPEEPSNPSEIEYLGQPYSHPDPLVRQYRYEQGMSICAELARHGVVVYAPIVHWHEISVRHNLPTDFEFWKKICLGMLAQSSRLIVAKLAGWEESKGLTAEREFAAANNIYIDYIDAPKVEAQNEMA